MPKITTISRRPKSQRKERLMEDELDEIFKHYPKPSPPPSETIVVFEPSGKKLVFKNVYGATIEKYGILSFWAEGKHHSFSKLPYRRILQPSE